MASGEETNQVNISAHSPNFTDAEDLLICSAWSNATNDSTIGTDQNGMTFWSKAHAYWLKYKDEDHPIRNPDALMQRFSRIRTAVSKFCGYLNEVQSLSGHGDVDKIEKAKEMYTELETKKGVVRKNGTQKKEVFKYLHCWNELKKNQKWLEETNAKPKGSQVQHNNDIPEGSEVPQNINVEDTTSEKDAHERPIGKKLAKEGQTKRKRKFVYDSAPLFKRIDQSRVMTEKICSENEIIFIEHDKKLDKLLEMKKERMELEKKKFAMDEKKYEMDEKKLEMDEKRADTNIMKVDVSMYSDPAQIEFFQLMRKDILEKYRSKMN